MELIPSPGQLRSPVQIRCPWCEGDALYTSYHDKEWGKPLKNNRKLFELLTLEGAQAGLSWITILRRREGYREAFDGFDAEKIARYTERDVKRLMADTRIIRNQRKIRSAIENARLYLEMMDGGRSFSKWLWNWVDGEPIVNHWRTMKEIPVTTELAEQISRELKKKGFSFVGPTIIYSYMQSAGLVNDHLVGCFRHPEHYDT
ncbi:DNA-3-methyladenine glycosylase [Spirochaetia bacterium]|nr:DNA-3-methyladenine glycosylase [Spirochaetia bacterium]GHV90148.1 DNA-3-methyladenine glycosylase [Spirochaetia bacterium]